METDYHTDLTSTEKSHRLRFFPQGRSMRNKLYLGFLLVVSALILTNFIVDYTTTNTHLGRLWFAVIGFVVGLVVCWLISKEITGDIENLVVASKTIGTGDLTRGVRAETNDEIGELAKSFNAMVLQLRKLITQLRESSNAIVDVSANLSPSVEDIKNTAEEVVRISAHISTGAKEQSDLADNTFAVMKRMADSIQMVAEKSQLTALAARRAGETAQLGKQSMEKTQQELDKVLFQYRKFSRSDPQIWK